MSFSDYIEEKVIQHLLKIAVWTPPANIYVALSAADPTDDASGLAEPSGNNYARKLHNAWDPDGQVGGSYQGSNNGVITFNTPSGPWGTLTHFALFDAITAGNMLGHHALDSQVAPDDGDTVQWADAALKVKLN